MNKASYIFLDIENKYPFSVDFVSWNQVMRDIRKGHKLTQTQLAKEFKYHISHVQRFEAGKVEPPIKFLQKFSKKFELNIEWLLFGEGSATKYSSSDPSSLRTISTKHIEEELRNRRQIANAYRIKARQARKDALSHSQTGNYTTFTNRLKKAQQGVIPKDAPCWLKEDLKDIYLEDVK